MVDPPSVPEPQGVRILCAECGDIVEVGDIETLVRTLHMVNECESRLSGLITPPS